MREYLDLEFREVEAILPFDYNLERIIDDFVLLVVFIGNDFLPRLPGVHINENGLDRLFGIYKEVLPSLGALTCNP
jgi:5'-3' exoribonuclease 1